MSVRAAEAIEIDRLANLWFDCWHESHAQIVPPELTRLRTLDSEWKAVRKAKAKSALKTLARVAPV